MADTLNWFSKNPRMTLGLRKLFTPKGRRGFTTIRLGEKWYDILRGQNQVAISISDDPAKPNVIGCARVRLVLRRTIDSLSCADLVGNIGAKHWRAVLRDMRKVYGKDKVTAGSLVSVIELFPILTKP